MRILMLGAGGVGGTLAAHIVRGGHDLTLVAHNAEIASHIQREGLTLCRRGRKVSKVRPTTVANLAELGSMRFDVALLAMKADGVVRAAESVLPVLTDDGFVVTFQNGLVEDSVSEAIGGRRVVASTIGWGATMHSPGVVEKTSPGRTLLGELDGASSTRVTELADILRTATPVEVSRNIRGVKWSKLAINATINPLGGILGEPLGVVVKRREAREVLLDLYAEVFRTAKAAGVVLERVAAPPWVLYRPRHASAWVSHSRHAVVRAMGLLYGGARSSLLQSLERGRPTEIDALNGTVVRIAEHHSVDVPLNRAMVEVVRALETGQRQPGPENLVPLLAASAGAA